MYDKCDNLDIWDFRPTTSLEIILTVTHIYMDLNKLHFLQLLMCIFFTITPPPFANGFIIQATIVYSLELSTSNDGYNIIIILCIMLSSYVNIITVNLYFVKRIDIFSNIVSSSKVL